MLVYDEEAKEEVGPSKRLLYRRESGLIRPNEVLRPHLPHPLPLQAPLPVPHLALSFAAGSSFPHCDL